MAVTLTLRGVDLNDGSTYTLLAGLDLGAAAPEYDVYVSYTGSLAATPARYSTVEVTVPLLVRAASVASLHAAVEALRGLVRSCTWHSPGALVYGDDGVSPTTYTIVDSADPELVRDELWYHGTACRVELRLRRLP